MNIVVHQVAQTPGFSLLPSPRHVPKYLLPRGMHVADLNRKRKRKKNKATTSKGNQQRRSDKDPLQSFNDGDVNLDGLEGDDDGIDDGFDQDMPDFSQGELGEGPTKKQKRDDSPSEKKVFANTQDGTGKSTAGRNAWKEKHRKGKFSGKKRTSERRQKAPLGI
jgi:hypothetical protein